ncbi:MAG TPA: sensor histidine kinase [Syntrophales bacterium]|nr:sensor histidine kinase [Syntrophales bacterium]
MELLFRLIQAMSVFLVIAYLYCKSPWFKPLTTDSLRARDKIYLYFFFSAVSIMGTYLGIPIQDAIANTRAIGPVLAGIIGGPILGTAVGFTGGLHRYSLGGFTAFSCGLSTTVEGTIGGLVHLYLRRTNRTDLVFNPKVAFITTFFAEMVQVAIILLVCRPYEDALAVVKVIAMPMILSSSVGTALFVSIGHDQKNVYERVAAISSAKAFKIAGRTLNFLGRGINQETAVDLARIIHEETGVGAVAITDREKVMAFIGHGSDHHQPGGPIVSPLTKTAIAENKVIFADGERERYICPLSNVCPLNSVLVVPLHIDNDVIGTIKLYEPRNKQFLNMNKTLGEGITNLLSNQLLLSRYERQKNLLIQTELKLLQAQINPHFLFNSLNTIISITRNNAARARELLTHLSNFFRKNLKRGNDLSTLEEELDEVNSYLQIEKARFDDRLVIQMDIDPPLLKLRVPTFTLQPLIENAIKHGISNMLEQGTAKIHAYRDDSLAFIEIEDNAGSFRENSTGDGLGIKIVDRRIKSLFGNEYGTTIPCVPNKMTRLTIKIPLEVHKL